MKDRGIIFSGHMVKAILAGYKTQTRRMARLTKSSTSLACYAKLKDSYAARLDDQHGLMWTPYAGATERPMPPDVVADFAPWRIGQRLWVRESFGYGWDNGQGGVTTQKPSSGRKPDGAIYRADAPEGNKDTYWQSPMFMPRWASRIELIIEGVQIERLQRISESDAEDEGLQIFGKYGPLEALAGLFCAFPGITVPEMVEGGQHLTRGLDGKFNGASWYGIYAMLWDHIHASKRDEHWDRNPWVWKITFKKSGPYLTQRN